VRHIYRWVEALLWGSALAWTLMMAGIAKLFTGIGETNGKENPFVDLLVYGGSFSVWWDGIFPVLLLAAVFGIAANTAKPNRLPPDLWDARKR
jgi:hypothetical protein